MAFISHLKFQQLFQDEMDVTCHRIINRWLSTCKEARCFKKRLELMLHFEDKKLPSGPPYLWWGDLLHMECFTLHSAKALRKIHGLTVLLSHHLAKLDCLISYWIDESGALWPLTHQADSQLDVSKHVGSGLLAVCLSRVGEFAPCLLCWPDRIIAAETD